MSKRTNSTIAELIIEDYFDNYIENRHGYFIEAMKDTNININTLKIDFIKWTKQMATLNCLYYEISPDYFKHRIGYDFQIDNATKKYHQDFIDLFISNEDNIENIIEYDCDSVLDNCNNDDIICKFKRAKL